MNLDTLFSISSFLDIVHHVEWLIVYFYLAINAVYALLLFSCIFFIFRRFTELQQENVQSIVTSNYLPAITFIVPAYNEECLIASSTQAILSLPYRYKEVIIVNDGSTDKTLDILKSTFLLIEIAPILPGKLPTEKVHGYYQSKLYPNLYVIDKDNGGKADSCNAGINACKTPIFITMDADTLIDGHAMNYLIQPFLSNPDTITCGAGIRVANGCIIKGSQILDYKFPKNSLAAIQVIEYLRAFYIGRLGWNVTTGPLIISGAFGIFKTEEVIQVGGYNSKTNGEDMELTLRLHQAMHDSNRPYRIAYIPDPVAWTEAPEDFKTLSKQRTRWHLGLIQSLWLHKNMLFNPRYGSIGMVSFPFFTLGELFLPIMAISGYLFFFIDFLLGQRDTSMFWYFFILSCGFATNLTMITLVLEELIYKKYPGPKAILKIIIYCFIENFGYRQFIQLSELRAFFQIKKKSGKWSDMQRKGFDAISATNTLPYLKSPEQ